MERVFNSVNQIITECNNMITQSEDCEYIDVRSLANSLRDECNKLNEFYNEHPEMERELSIKKIAVEELAIRLEFYMDVRLGLYTERRKLRVAAKKIYEDLNLCMHENIAKGNKENILLLGSSMKWALTFMSRSEHIVFEKDERDERELVIIAERLNEMRGK